MMVQNNANTKAETRPRDAAPNVGLSGPEPWNTPHAGTKFMCAYAEILQMGARGQAK